MTKATTDDDVRLHEPHEFLDLARDYVTGNRSRQHGDYFEDMRRTAAIWAVYLGVTIDPVDVPIMLTLMKVVRSRVGDTDHQDHYVDMCGYSAIAGAVAQMSKNLRDGSA